MSASGSSEAEATVSSPDDRNPTQAKIADQTRIVVEASLALPAPTVKKSRESTSAAGCQLVTTEGGRTTDATTGN